MICDAQVKHLSGVQLPIVLNIHAAFIFAFSIDCTDLECDTTYEGALLYFIVDIRLLKKKSERVNNEYTPILHLSG